MNASGFGAPPPGKPGELPGPAQTAVISRPTVQREVERRLAAGPRWLTIVGPPGCGKSTVARAAAKQRALALSLTSETLDVARLVERGQDVIDWVEERASSVSHCGVILLDNVESRHHELWLALDAALSQSERTQVVATSSRRFGHDAESVYYLPALSNEESRSLLHQLASSLGAPPTALEPAAVETAVRLLDGSPLALRLFARHLVAVPLAALCVRLQHDIQWLTGTDPSVPDRHRSLPLMWHKALMGLDDGARSLLVKLSSFDGDFSWHDVQRIWPDSDLAQLTTLLEHSLIRYTSEKQTYRIYHTLRAHVLDEGADAASARGAYARFLIAGASEHCNPNREGKGVGWLLRHGAGLVRYLSTLSPLERRQAKIGRACIAAVRYAAWANCNEDCFGWLADVADGPRTRLSLRIWRCQVGVKLALRLGKVSWAVEECSKALSLVSRTTPRDDPELHEARLVLSADLASALRQTGRSDAEVLARAREWLRETPESRGKAHLFVALAVSAMERGDLSAARQWFEEASCAANQEELPLLEGIVWSNRGVLLHELNELGEARANHRAALHRHEALGHRRFEAIAHYDLGALAAEHGSPLEAKSLLESGLGLAAEANDLATLGMLWSTLGVVLTGLDRASDADHAFQHGKVLLERAGSPGLLEAHEVHQTHRRLRRALLAFASGNHAEFRAEVDGAAATLHAARTTSDEVRFAERLLRRHMEEVNNVESGALIARDGTWLATFRGVVQFRSESPQARLLSALVSHYEEQQGAPLAAAVLIRSAWPSQRTIDKGAMNRLHVALNALRKAGLRAHLTCTPGGYQLERVVPWRGAT